MSDDLSPRDAPEPEATRTGRAAVHALSLTLLGACTALMLATLSDAVLLPEVDRTPPRALGFSVVGSFLALGWWLSLRRAQAVDGSSVMLYGGGLLVGAGVSLASLDPLHGWLVDGLSRGSPLPYPVIIVLAVAGCAAPLAIPMGGLLGLAFGPGGRRAVACSLGGAAFALALAPTLIGELIGARNTLAGITLLGAASAISMYARAPWPTGPARLGSGAMPTLVVLGATAAVADHLAAPLVDLGTNVTCWLAAAVCLSGALAALLPQRLAWSPLDVTIALGATWGLAGDPIAYAFPTIGLQESLGRLAYVGVPIGISLGLLLSRRRTGPGVGWFPFMALLLVPAVSWRLLPQLGPGPLLGLLSVGLMVIALVSRERPTLGRWLIVLLAGGVIFANPLPETRGGQRAMLEWRLPDGRASLLQDPGDGRSRIAIDGVAALGRHPLQESRLVHLPMLLQGAPERVLLVATDSGEAEAAVLAHEPADLDWLRPFPVPGVRSLDPEPPGRRRPQGSERMFLSGEDVPYDVIVMMPDPRVRRRAGLVATREFYALARDHLEPGGIFCQWWDPAFMAAEDLVAALASADAEFATTTLLVDHPRSRRGLIGLLGLKRDLGLRPQEMRRRLDQLPTVAAELDAVGLDPLTIACLVGPAPEVVPLLAPRREALLDERPRLGARGGLHQLSQPETLHRGLDLVADHRAAPLDWMFVPEQHLNVAHTETRAVYDAFTQLFRGARTVVREHGLDAPAFEAEHLGGFPGVEEEFILEALRVAPDWPYLERVVVARAAFLEAVGYPGAAVDWLHEALEVDIKSTRLRVELARLLEEDGALDQAALLYRSILALAPEHEFARDALKRLEG